MFEGYTFKRDGRSGLFLADVAAVHEVEEYNERLLEKAQRGAAFTPGEQKIYNKMQRIAARGSLFSPYYRSLFSNIVTYGAADKPAGTATASLLRDTAKKSLIDALVINARLFQVRMVARRVVVEGKQKGFKVRHKRHSDPQFEMTPAIRNTALAIEDAIELALDRSVHPSGIRDFLVQSVQGELILDRKVMIIQRDQLGRPLSYYLLPPETVKPRLQVLLKHMPENVGVGASRGAKKYTAADFDKATDAIYEQFGVDVSNAAYVQEVDNVILGAWSADEISVDVVSPSDELDRFGWGVSPLERSLEATTFLLQAFHYNKQQFLTRYPEAFLMIHGDVDEEGLEEFRQQIYAEVGPQGNQRLPVFATGDAQSTKAELLKVRDSLKDMDFVQLIRMCVGFKCSAYRAHPSLINMSPDQGQDAAPVISNNDQAFQIDLSQEEGLGSLIQNQGDWWTAALVRPCAGWAEYEVIFDTTAQPTQKEQIEIWEKKLDMGYTVDEFRASFGDGPLAEATNGETSGAYINSQFYFQQAQIEQQRMQEQIAAVMGPQAGQGDENGDSQGYDEQQAA